MSKVYPVLLAGGSGTRLWPLSRKSYPKQFSNLIASAKNRLTTWHLVRNVLILRSPKKIALEQPIFSRTKVSQLFFDGAGVRMGVGGFGPESCEKFNQNFSLPSPHP
jgi:hypothetical protein